MKSVRVFYKKKSRLKFVSHLDMNRFMPRLIRKTEIPVWYTEGFNSHVYINFALPLSLGFESDYEVMDFKVTDDSYPTEKILSELIRVCPRYIEIIKVAEPAFKVGEIAYAEFEIVFEDGSSIATTLESFLNEKSIVALKKNKKGIIKELELSDKIARYEILNYGNTILKIVLSAGTDNVNPQLLLAAFENKSGVKLPDYSITRTMLYTRELKPFI